MTKWLALLCSFAALGLVAGCGGDDEEEPSGGGGGSGAATKEEKPADGGAGGKAAKVSMKDIAFNPQSVTVAKGGKVTWTNDDTVGHDVTKTGGPGADFKSGDAGGMQGGDTFSQTFATAGKVDYVCTVHPNMTASVTVK